MGGMSRRRLTALVAFLSVWAAAPQLLAAEELGLRSPWHLRGGLSGALMISSDQLDWLAYDQPGVVAELQLGYAILPWLDLQVGSTFGLFPSEQDNGGVAEPMIGALARLSNDSVTPYAFADIGGAFTGAMFLPMLRAGVGLEIRASDSLRLGPMVSFGSVLYSNEPENSTDARYVAIGFAGVYSSVPVRQKPRKLAQKPPPKAAEPVVIREPTTEILKLVDRAVPARTDRVELLAPVLFSFDSDALEPIGVAMLHEVARFLGERPDLEQIEIRAYADARGSADYNRELAGRRGQRVFDWLIEHGIDPARLIVAPVGSTELVESGDAESAHEQNRRVVFRVLRIRGAE
jgi:outer membrane protein OmpA-like peptidoglycan-associated protein